MMNLRSKLSRLQSEAGGEHKRRQPLPAASNLRRRLAGIGVQRVTTGCSHSLAEDRDEKLAQRLKGYLIAEGVVRMERRLPLDSMLGRGSLANLRNALSLPGEGREAHLRQVYVDTETTGLAGGSGTVAFLVGMAVVEQDALVVTQYLLTRFAGEAAMLKAFAGALTAEDRLVSYNGKSFDLPLLVTRYRMQGVRQPFEGLSHLDLLHPIRRLFRSRWPDCRLTTLEAQLLGFRRQQDLPGSEAPAAWSGYLSRGEEGRLIRVVEHNRQDIVSLAMAHAMLVSVVEQPETHGVDIVSLARWLSPHDRKGAYQLLKTTRQPLGDSGRRLLAHWARGEQEWGLAIGLWEDLAAKGCRESAEQLAKYHEHVSRDLDVAKRYCEQMRPGSERARRLERITVKQYQQTIQSRLSGL